MQEASMYLGDSYANAFVHELAWEGRTLAYARLAGRPAFVRAMAAGLMNGIAMSIADGKSRRVLSGVSEARSLFNRIGKDIGVATFFSVNLFSSDKNFSYIIGKDKEFLNRTFMALLRRRPIVCHESWNMVKVFNDLNYLEKIDGMGVMGYKITWNDQLVNEYLSEQVRMKKLKFW